jgi:hypothetical protein
VTGGDVTAAALQRKATTIMNVARVTATVEAERAPVWLGQHIALHSSPHSRHARQFDRFMGALSATKSDLF